MEGAPKYQPTPEEIKKAEESMTEEQKMKSEIREEAYTAGIEKGVEKRNKEIDEQKKFEAARKNIHEDLCILMGKFSDDRHQLGAILDKYLKDRQELGGYDNYGWYTRKTPEYGVNDLRSPLEIIKDGYDKCRSMLSPENQVFVEKIIEDAESKKTA